LLKPNSYELTVTDGKLSGAGSDFLMEASSNAQFFALGEPHNAKQVPEITSMLFQALHERRGFNYLALEQDPVVTQMVSAKSVVGKRDYVVSLANQYPNAFTFTTDQELEMIAEAGSIPKERGTEFGAWIKPLVPFIS
jgi:erythromycin esterase-like protein